MSGMIGGFNYNTRSETIGDFCVILMDRVNVKTGESLFDASIRSYSGKDTVVKIPAKFGKYITTGIHAHAFYNNNFIKTISIPDTIINIGTHAFNGCTKLETIWVVSTFTNRNVNDLWLSDGVFSDCENLEKILLGEKEILTYAASGGQFKNCPKLCCLQASLKYVRAGTFASCDNLETLTVADDGFFEPKSLNLLTSLKSISFKGNIDIKNMSKRVLSQMAKLKISCPKDSNVMDLAYLGADISIT